MTMRALIDLIETLNPDDITKNDDFMTWFHGSKIVDDRGRPLPVYHGTTQDFDTFDADHAAWRGGLLAFFSTSPKFASSYATDNRGANVMPCYLKSVRPFDFRKDWKQAEYFWEDTGGLQEITDINRILMGLGTAEVEDLCDDSGHELTQEQFVSVVKAGGWDALEAGEFVEYLRGEGFDSIVLLENGAINFGIFEPEQVKSAFARSFDGDDARVTEQRTYRAP